MAGIGDPRTLEHCLLELIINSLQAKATAIAVRIQFHNQNIQVVDNGFGITKKELKLVAHDTVRKGSLDRIKEISSLLIVMSKSQLAAKTYGKCFSNGKEQKIKEIDDRPTSGTTVTVKASEKLSNWKEDSSAIKFIIICLSLVNPQVSFSVRDDMRGRILLRIGKFQKPHQLLGVIFDRSVSSAKIKSIKTQIGKVKISILWGVECTSELRIIHQVLLNLKPVNCRSLEKAIIRIIAKKHYPPEENKNLCGKKIFFLAYIECPDSDYNLYVKDTKLTADFHQINEIVDAIEQFFRKVKPRKSSKTFVKSSKVKEKISKPFGRILGGPKKISFCTRAFSHKFQRPNNLVRMEIKYLREIRKVKKSSPTAFNNLNRDIVVPVPENFHSVISELIEEEEKSQKIMETKKFDESVALTPRIVKINENRSENPLNDESKVSREIKSFPGEKQNDSMKTQRINEKSCDTSEFIIVSQYWAPNSIEAAEVNGEGREVIVKDKKCFDLVLEEIEHEISNDLPIVKEYQYDNHGVLWISQRCNDKVSNRKEEMCDIDFSQWSDWNYKLDTSDFKSKKFCEETRPVYFKRFRFLPLQLHALLPFLKEKLINRNLTDHVTLPFNVNFNNRRQDLDVRACTRRPFEFRLEMESLKSMKILNQVNKEFIVALTKQNEKKLVVIIDQHAMHERIRYENLLRAYKRDQKNEQFISIALRRPIIISDFSTTSCDILSSNKFLLVRYGLNISLRNESTLLILSVPRCFMNKTYRSDYTEVEISVRKLMREFLENIEENGTTKMLPFTINDAIASEACHGAIKFGDSLTSKECESLVACWTETEAPNRCAHGRPSVVPLLDLSSQRSFKNDYLPQKKLNFASLRKYR